MSFFALLRRSSWISLLPWQLLILVVMLTSYWPAADSAPPASSSPDVADLMLWFVGAPLWFSILPLLRVNFERSRIDPYPGEFEFVLPLEPGRLLRVRFLALNLAILLPPFLYLVTMLARCSVLYSWNTTTLESALGLAAFGLSWFAFLPVWIQVASTQRGKASHRLQLFVFLLLFLFVLMLLAASLFERPGATPQWLGLMALFATGILQAEMLSRCFQPIEYAGGRAGSVESDRSHPPMTVVALFLVAIVSGFADLNAIFLCVFHLHVIKSAAVRDMGALDGLPVSPSRRARGILSLAFYIPLFFVLIHQSREYVVRLEADIRMVRETDGFDEQPPRLLGYVIRGRMGWPALGWGDSVWFLGGKEIVSSHERVRFLGDFIPLWVQGDARLPATTSLAALEGILTRRARSSFGVDIPSKAIAKAFLAEASAEEQEISEGVILDRQGATIAIRAGGAVWVAQKVLLLLSIAFWVYSLFVVLICPKRRYPQHRRIHVYARLRVLLFVILFWMFYRLESLTPESLLSAYEQLVSLMPPLYLSWLLPLASGWFLLRLIRRRTQAFEVPSSPCPDLTESWLGPRGEWRSIRPIFGSGAAGPGGLSPVD